MTATLPGFRVRVPIPLRRISVVYKDGSLRDAWRYVIVIEVRLHDGAYPFRKVIRGRRSFF